MAGEGKTIEKLFIELGLDLSKLQSDILAADKTVTENLGRINREKSIIKLRMEADIAGLDRLKDATKILEIQERALNQQLTLSRDKLAILEAAYKQVASNANSTAVAVNRAEQAFLREKIAVANLESELKILASQKVSPPTNKLLSGYLNIKGDVVGRLNEITSAFSNLQTATSSADSAITAALGVIGTIPHPVGKAVAALASIPLVVKGIENSFLDLARVAIGKGDAFYVMSRGMQLSVADMAKLSTIAKVTGIDINEVNNTLRRFSMQMNKADEKSSLAVQTLRRYGAEIYDANGHLKNGVELSLELGKALKAAQAEGNGAAFRDIVGGKFWSGDFVTYLEDFADNVEQAKKVVKNGLANPTWAHAIQGELNTMNAQAEQLKGVLSSALMPVAAEIVPKTTERLGQLTKVIELNKENIKFLGDVLATPIRLMNEMTESVVSLSNAMDAAKDKGTIFGEVIQSLGQKRDDLSALLNVAPLTGFMAMQLPGSSLAWIDLAVSSYRDEVDEFKRLQEQKEAANKATNDELQARKANTLALNRETLAQQEKVENALASMEERRVQNVREAENIIFSLRHNTYEKSLRDIELWEKEQLRAIEELNSLGKNLFGREGLFDEEKQSVLDLGGAKRLQLEEEREEKLSEIRERIAAAEQTELEKRIANIEKEKETWIQAGMEKAEAEQLAEQQKASYINDVNQELSNAINALHQSDFEKQLARIEEEKQAWINKGAEVAQAEQLAQEQIQQAYEQRENTLNEIRASVMAAEKNDLEVRLANIEKEKQAWIQKGMDEAEAAELAQVKIQKLYEERAEAIAKAYEDAAQKAKQAAEEADRKNEELRNRAFNVLKQEAKEFETFLKEGYEGLQKLMYDKLIKSGVNPESLKQMTPEKLEAYEAAKKEANRSFLPNWKDPYSAEPVDVNLPKNLNATSGAAANAAESLNNLANTANNATGGRYTAYDEDKTPYVNNNSLKVYERPDGSVEISNLKELVDAEKQALTTLGKQAGQTAEQLSNIPKVDYDDLSGLYEFANETQSAAQSLDGIPEVTQEATQSLNEIPSAVQGAIQSLSELEIPQGANTDNIFASIEPEVQRLMQQFSSINEAGMEFVQHISNMSMGVEEVTVKLSDLSAAIQNFSLPQSQSNSGGERTPVAVNTSIQIEEAHAWDYDHIQELAEKVADILEPRIIRAVGGDSNAY